MMNRDNHWLHATQLLFCRRRHQPRRPPLAKIRPGSPAPAMGTGTTGQEIPSGQTAPVNPPEVSPTPTTRTLKAPLGALELTEKPKLVERIKSILGGRGGSVCICWRFGPS